MPGSENVPALPAKYQVTANNELFLIFHSGVGDPEIYIFFSLQRLVSNFWKNLNTSIQVKHLKFV